MSKRKPKDLKYDQGKVRMDLLPFDCLTEIAKVLTYGAVKYEANSWQTVKDNYNRYRGSLLRHLSAMEAGEDIDQSGLPHAAHLACNGIFLLWFTLHKEPTTPCKACCSGGALIFIEESMSFKYCPECGRKL